MNECETTPRVHALYDGALLPAERTRVEAHLRECPPCSSELERLKQLTSLLARVKPSQPWSGLRGLQTHFESRRLRAQNGFRLVRLTGWLTAAAAVVMMACGVALYASETPRRTTTLTDATEGLNWAVASQADSVLQSQTEQEAALLQAVAPKDSKDDVKDEQP